MPSDPLETLKQVNQTLQSALIRLDPERTHCTQVRPQDFSVLLNQIVSARQCMHQARTTGETGAALQEETRRYARNLKALKHFLLDLHGRLLAEKSRLETARSHAEAAAAWTEASKKTL